MSVTVAQKNIVEKSDIDDFVNEIDDEIHDSIDKIIEYYQSQKIEPRFTFSGSPLDIASDLARNVKASLPESHQEDGKITIDYMIQQFVDYCREIKSNSLTITFAFKTGKII